MKFRLDLWMKTKGLCIMPIFRRRKTQTPQTPPSHDDYSNSSCNGYFSENNSKSQIVTHMTSAFSSDDIKPMRPNTLFILDGEGRRSHTAPSTPDISGKSFDGTPPNLDNVTSQILLSSTKAGLKNSSPVMSSSRKGHVKESSPTCSKSRSEKFHKLFKCVPDDEIPIDYFSCAFLGDILLHGNLYVSPNWICFYSKIRARGRQLEIPMEKVLNISREKTALIIPNAIGIQTSEEKYVFGSFLTRDSTYRFLVKTWKNSQDSTDSTKDQSISSPEPSKGNLSETFSPSATSSPTENNNIVHSVIDTPKLPAVVSVQNGNTGLDSSDSDMSVCPECGLADESDTDRIKKLSASKNTGDKSSVTQNTGPHAQYFTQCFQFHKTYDAICHLSLKLQRIPRTSFLLAICTFMVLFLLISAVGLTYKLLLLQAKLESRHIWNDVLRFEHQEKTYSDIHSFHSQVHTATVQQLHGVLQANIQLLNEMQTSLKNLHTIYSPPLDCKVSGDGETNDCS